MDLRPTCIGERGGEPDCGRPLVIALSKQSSGESIEIATASDSDFARALCDPSATQATYAFEHAKDILRQLIVGRKLSTICEVGGGRSPMFTVQEVRELNLSYTVLDISAAELELTPPSYTKIIGDICSLPSAHSRAGSYDLVFSYMLAEHVSSGEAMHRNIFRLLRPGGMAFHFFPTLFSPAFVANKLLPERLAQWALTLTGWRQHHEKFPAKYSWCYGPSPQRKQKLTALGYTVLDYRPFYGTYYLQFVPGVRQLELRFHKMATRRHSRWFTSYAWLILMKSEQSPAAALQSPTEPTNRHVQQLPSSGHILAKPGLRHTAVGEAGR